MYTDKNEVTLVAKQTATTIETANGGKGYLVVDTSGNLKIIASASENHLGEIGANMKFVAVEETLPASVITYAANTVVSNSATTTTPMTFASAGRISGGTGYISGIKIFTDKKQITPRFRLHFYNLSTATVAADAVTYKDLYTDIAKKIGYYDMPALITPADTTNSTMSYIVDLTCRIPFKLDATTSSIYVVKETLDSFTRNSGQKITVALFLDNN